MKNRIINLLLISCVVLISNLQAQNVARKPVFKVDVANPTMDKPQSKLWYMDNQWWALLPKANGPSLWQRTAKGWIEDVRVNKALSGNPGRVDVWAGGNQVMAVGVGTDHLVVYQLKKEKSSWKVEVMGRLMPPAGVIGDMETATIVRDDSGSWWVAADFGDKVLVWTSVDGRKWNAPVELASGLNKDDISTLTVLTGGIGLIWSDQNQDAVKFRFHANQGSDWSTVELIEQGNLTADDHLHAAIGQDGRLWVATKNSVDEVGKPQLVLRIRETNGSWKNLPFADLYSVKKPSRPVVFTTEQDGPVLIGYTEYDGVNSNLGTIKFGVADLKDREVVTRIRTVISPLVDAPKNTLRINDITGSKASFPKDGPWIILASDQLGNIYELDLRSLFGKAL